MKNVWNWMQVVMAAIGGGLGWFFGELDGFFYALIAFVVIDYLTGVMCAIVDKSLSSEVGFKGIFRKVLIFVMVGIGHVIDAQIIGSGDALREKAMRDMKLLLKELERDPGNPYHCFQVAQSYMLMRDSENALLYFQKALERNPDPMADYTHILLYNYGHLLLEQGRAEEAAFLLDYHAYYRDNMDYLCLTGLLYLHQNQPLKALTEFVDALAAPGGDLADRREPSYYIGYIYELFGKPDIAKTHYRNCGEDYAPAKEALARLSQAQ